MKLKFNKDPFETISWSLNAYKKPKEVIADIFTNEDVVYCKTLIQSAFSYVYHIKSSKRFQDNDLFSLYLRVNSLILVGAYYYNSYKNKIEQKEQVLIEQVKQNDGLARRPYFLKTYADPQYRIYSLFEMEDMPYWKSEWSYFVLAAYGKHKVMDTEIYHALNYFVHTLIDALHDMFKESGQYNDNPEG